MLDDIATEIAVEEHGTQNLSSFLGWLDDGGVTCPKMQITEVDGVRGVIARTPIKAGELVLHIPKSALLTMAAIRASGSPVAAAMAASGGEFAEITYLTAFLIESRRQRGAWLPYIALLPEETPEPGQCRGRVAELLKGTDIDPRTRPGSLNRVGQAMLEQYRLLAPLLEPLSLREFAGMWNAVATRNFTVEIGGRKTCVIAPLADMLNHADAETYNVAWTRGAADGFRFIALRDIDAGAELKDAYGPYSNAELFTRYDFCLTENCHDRAEIGLPAILPAHPFFAHAEGLGTQQNGMRVFRVTAKPDTEQAKQMLSYLRLACLADVGALRQALPEAKPGVRLPVVSETNERAVRAQLRRACLRALERYERSIDDDDRLLAGSDLAWAERCAILVGRGEKRVLHHYADAAWHSN